MCGINHYSTNRLRVYDLIFLYHIDQFLQIHLFHSNEFIRVKVSLGFGQPRGYKAMNCFLIITNRWIIGKKMGHFFSLVTSLFLNLPKSAFPWSFTIFQSPSWNLQNISMWKSMLPYKNDLSFLIKRKNCSCSWMLYYLTTNFSPFYCEIYRLSFFSFTLTSLTGEVFQIYGFL